MNDALKRLVPNGLKEYFRKAHLGIEHNAVRIKELQTRIGSVERVLDTLISNPVYTSSEETGFNGQSHRKKIFSELLAAIRFKSILETGTFMGDTTGFMAEVSHLPIYTSEINPRYSMFAQKRLAAFDTIHFSLGDSRAFLRKMAAESVSQPVFFYLDAHWYEDLPLLDECNLILNNWRDVVIMVDDFQSPLDASYGYDDYGNGQALTLEYLKDVIKSNGLVACFPSVPANEETGLRRGCVVLARMDGLGSIVAGLPSLTAIHHV